MHEPVHLIVGWLARLL